MPYRVRPNRRCLRGLHWDFELEPAPDLDSLAEALQRGFAGGLVVGEERYGNRRVVRLIKQFECELRLGEWAGTRALHHRQCASAEVRRRNRNTVQRVLQEVFALSEAPAA